MKTFDRFELMQLFVRIAETGSLSAAGRSIGLSQPSTSRQLKQLETILGTKLVKRSTHDLTLTEAGQRFLTDSRAMLAGWDRSVELLRQERKELKGALKVAAPTPMGQNILATIAARFLLQHPGVWIEWRLVDEPKDLVGDGYDLWIRAGQVRDEALIVRDLWLIERTLVAATGCAAADHPRELAGRNAVLLSTFVPRELPLQGPRDETHELKLRPVFTTDNIYATLSAVEEGVGYAVLPFWLVQAGLDAGRLVQLCPAWRPPPLTLSVAFPPDRYRPARVGAFLDFLCSELPRTGAGIVAIPGTGARILHSSCE